MNNTEIEERCNALRLDLKTWEKKFSAAHDGRKAGREDIKADAITSQKYKEYNKLRDVLTGKAAPATPSRKTESRRVHRNIDRTPKASRTLATTPKRKREDSGTLEAAASPEQILSPEGPAFIGPTPQRNGIAIGLFDHLAETPSKGRDVLTDVALNIVQTPDSHAREAESEISLESRARGEKTPQSIGKRLLLNSFMAVTPSSKRKFGDQGTPSSGSKGFATPAFLRRYNPLMKIDEDEEPAPRPAPWMRRTLGRTLSERLQAMRQEQEEEFDEQAEIMREFEMEAEGMPAPKKIKISEVQVEDSQGAMPLGPDRGEESEDDEAERENGLGPDGKPKKVWKKRGLKRQTRRVIMKPNFAKPKPQPELQHDDSDDDTPVAETQPDPFNIPSELDLSDFNDDDGSDYASDASHTAKKRKVQQPKPKDTSTSQTKDGKEKKEGPVKAAARKIKPWAHANYQRLKIKSKGGNGGKGRFAHLKSMQSYSIMYIRNRTFEGSRMSWASERAWVTAKPVISRQAPTPTSLPPPSSTPRSPNTRITTPPPALQPAKSPHSSKKTPSYIPAMADRELADLLKQLHQTLQSKKYQQAGQLLSRAKIALLGLNALIPTEQTPPKHLHLARETLELGAIISIRLEDPVSFTRYFQQLQPFYSLPEDKLPRKGGNSSKITGLYLLLLLSDGDYAGFHTLLETLEVAAAQAGRGLEDDQFIQYPIRLEQALMEGSYDQVWRQTKGQSAPSEEFALFTDVLVGTIRKEIASCSEKAYPSIPISDAKSLLFLDSEGAVINFAKESGWVVEDGRIYFPQEDGEFPSKDILVTSDQVIENTLGYARELETIV
ncbi:hypothetical protein BU23DRAFT_445748 [Bimuria novae-zelandiae CBS 107.79]|uniref:DNA replication regulator SLD2 n=1 Tax=Bimuria novae-zelandiae CBS 107.79 TaxID=1447943 RepID=A0A6A5VS83_9PLEO|nr:hypothetical protein BU23DRAFT_445748 [Bimuria novae-zelandiae CBS 107.79]